MPKKSRSRTEQAALLLKKAEKQSALAKVGIEMESDDISVTFLFQAYENAVRAATKATGQFADTGKHWDLSGQASELVEQGYLQTDVSDRLEELNQGRKTSAYGYEEDFEHSDFNEILEEIEEFIDEVRELIERGGKKRTADEKS
jgi:HEPN domain-containing protein